MGKGLSEWASVLPDGEATGARARREEDPRGLDWGSALRDGCQRPIHAIRCAPQQVLGRLSVALREMHVPGGFLVT